MKYESRKRPLRGHPPKATTSGGGCLLCKCFRFDSFDVTQLVSDEARAKAEGLDEATVLVTLDGRN